MRHQLPDDWTLDVDSGFTRRNTDDGFTVFERPGMQIWAVIYCGQPFDSALAVRSYLSRYNTLQELPFPGESEQLAGRAGLTRYPEYWSLTAVAASLGRIAKIEFCFPDRADLDAALAILHTLQHSPPHWVRLCAKAEPPLADLREALESFPRLREALDTLTDAQKPHAVPVLLEALAGGPPGVRWAACEAFRLLGIATEEALPALRARLQDEVVQVRAFAADALLDLGEPAAAVVPSMIEGLKNQEPPLAAGEQRVQGACSHLQIPDRYHAARILSSIGEAARPAKDVLLAHQMDESGSVRLRVAEALLNLGESESVVLPPLLDGFHSPQMSHRERVWFAKPLLELGVSHSEVVPGLIRILENEGDYSAQSEAVEFLGMLGDAAAPAVGVIEKAILRETREWGIKTPAAQALMPIGAKTELAQPILRAALGEDLHFQTRAEVIADLGRSVPLDSADAARILQELDSDDLLVRSTAASVLAHSGVAVERSMGILIETLDEPSNQIRWKVIVALGELGVKGEAAVERLMQVARSDDSREVRLAAVWALGCIGRNITGVKALFGE